MHHSDPWPRWAAACCVNVWHPHAWLVLARCGRVLCAPATKVAVRAPSATSRRRPRAVAAPRAAGDDTLSQQVPTQTHERQPNMHHYLMARVRRQPPAAAPRLPPCCTPHVTTPPSPSPLPTGVPRHTLASAILTSSRPPRAAHGGTPPGGRSAEGHAGSIKGGPTARGAAPAATPCGRVRAPFPTA